MNKIKAAIIGPGNIGTDLMYKVLRSKNIDMALMAGIVESEGIARAKKLGIETSVTGAEAFLERKDIRIVFDATSAKAHIKNAPLLKQAGKIVIDLTPAAIGPFVVPCVNLDELSDESNLNMVTCGGQATIPIVYAVSRAAQVNYAEIVACIASRSAGPGTRANIDEFTRTTARAISLLGRAKKSKAIIVLNPAEPPIMMTNTIYIEVEKMDEKAILLSIEAVLKEIQAYVPGYQLRVPPLFDGNRVTTIIQVEGAGDFLPKYGGNLDIINSAAIAVGEKLAAKMLTDRINYNDR
ncbi:MAG: acetaldehyde dehydrogenase (acetylating) [Actinomycetota bacterium]